MTKRNPMREKPRSDKLRWAAELPIGSFEGRLTGWWAGSHDFRYEPGDHPLTFVRANGERWAMVKRCKIDGMSAPHAALVAAGLERWDYVEAVAIHDYFWDAHPDRSHAGFELVNLVMAEAMRTLQEAGSMPRNLHDIIHAHRAISSVIGWLRWK